MRLEVLSCGKWGGGVVGVEGLFWLFRIVVRHEDFFRNLNLFKT